MKYYFILGNNPALSIAELLAVFSNCRSQVIGRSVLIIETLKEINPNEIIKKIGGTKKIGAISKELKSSDKKGILNEIIKLTDNIKIKNKFIFGISYYGPSKFNVKPLAMEIKKNLREKKIKSRWITSREQTLSSVIIEQNKLISDGLEVSLIEANGAILIGRTLAVQPFKELSFRDYGRPARDDYSGMLPPKLAQIMINLACPGEKKGAGSPKTEPTLLDPFCGSGTIITESLLMSYKNLIGADISRKALADTKKNVAWIAANFSIKNFNLKLLNKSSLELSKYIKLASVDAIITEPYLGPQRGKFDIKKIKNELEDIYGKSLIEFYKILKPMRRLVIISPIFNFNNGLIALTFNLNGFKIFNPLPNLNGKYFPEITDRKTIIYGREGQKVWREIIILEK